MHNASAGPGNRSLFQDWKGGKIALTTSLVSPAPKGAQLASLDKTCLGISGKPPTLGRGLEETMTGPYQEQKPLLHVLRPGLPPPTSSPRILTHTPSSWVSGQRPPPPGLGLDFLLPPLGFCFVVCLVKGPWVVIETVFWL